MKRNHFLWIIPLIALGLLLILPGDALAHLASQSGSPTPTPTLRPLYPEDVTIPQTHFPGLIVGAIVIVVIILVGVLIRPRK